MKTRIQLVAVTVSWALAAAEPGLAAVMVVPRAAGTTPVPIAPGAILAPAGGISSSLPTLSGTLALPGARPALPTAAVLRPGTGATLPAAASASHPALSAAGAALPRAAAAVRAEEGATEAEGMAPAGLAPLIKEARTGFRQRLASLSRGIEGIVSRQAVSERFGTLGRLFDSQAARETFQSPAPAVGAQAAQPAGRKSAPGSSSRLFAGAAMANAGGLNAVAAGELREGGKHRRPPLTKFDHPELVGPAVAKIRQLFSGVGMWASYGIFEPKSGPSERLMSVHVSPAGKPQSDRVTLEVVYRWGLSDSWSTLYLTLVAGKRPAFLVQSRIEDVPFEPGDKRPATGLIESAGLSVGKESVILRVKKKDGSEEAYEMLLQPDGGLWFNEKDGSGIVRIRLPNKRMEPAGAMAAERADGQAAPKMSGWSVVPSWFDASGLSFVSVRMGRDSNPKAVLRHGSYELAVSLDAIGSAKATFIKYSRFPVVQERKVVDLLSEASRRAAADILRAAPVPAGGDEKAVLNGILAMLDG